MEGMPIFSSLGDTVGLSDKLEEFMRRSFKVLKGVMQSIVGFIAVDDCVKHPFLAKLCCY